MTLPSSLKLRRGQTKWLVRQVATSYLPAAIFERPKIGFRVPLDEWFRGDLAGFVHDGLLADDSFVAGTLNGAANGEDVVDFNKDDTTPTNTGQAICVLDIKRFAEPTAFKRQVDAVIRQLHGSALLPGFDRIRLPGEDRAQRIAERTKSGIPIPGSLKAALDKMAEELGIEKLLA